MCVWEGGSWLKFFHTTHISFYNETHIVRNECIEFFKNIVVKYSDIGAWVINQ